MTIFFKNKVNEPTQMKEGDFTLIKCPSSKKSIKLQKIRMKEKGFSLFRNIQKSPLSYRKYYNNGKNDKSISLDQVT